MYSIQRVIGANRPYIEHLQSCLHRSPREGKEFLFEIDLDLEDVRLEPLVVGYVEE